MLAGGECDDPHRFAGRDAARHRCDARDRTGPACRVERNGGAADRAGAARAASAGTAHRPVRRELAEPVCALWPAGAAPLQSRPLRPGRRLVLGFRERGTQPLALCGTMGPEWNDLGFSYTCELAADAAELDGDGALHRLPLRGRAACLRLTGSGAKLETLLRSRAARRSAFCSRRLHSAARMARRRSSWRSVICCRTAIRLRWSPGCRRFWRSGAED